MTKINILNDSSKRLIIRVLPKKPEGKPLEAKFVPPNHLETIIIDSDEIFCKVWDDGTMLFADNKQMEWKGNAKDNPI